MKSFAIRASVIVLALTGFASSTVLANAGSKKPEIKPVLVGTIVPAPMCAPSDPSHCGMD